MNFIDVFGCHLKEVFDVIPCFSGCFHVIVKSIALCRSLTILKANLSFVFLINHVSDQIKDRIFFSVLSHFIYPIWYTFKRFLICHIKYHNDQYRVSIENSSDWSKTLRSSGVPDLKFANFILYFHNVISKFNSHCSIVMIILKFLPSDWSQNARLSNSLIAYNDDFNQAIVNDWVPFDLLQLNFFKLFW